MIFVKDIVIGIVIGGGLVLPGVSGAVLAVIFGIYEKLINAVGHFFNAWKHNLFFLTPIIIGIGIGCLIFGNILGFLFKYYRMEACFTFIGLILGGLPVIFNKIKINGNINIKAFFISLIISILLFVVGTNFININFNIKSHNILISWLLLFLTGIIFISGKIIPGISSSFLLMLIGMYNKFLYVISNPFSLSISEYISLIPVLLGIIVGMIFLIKLIEYLFKYHICTTYSVIMGFVIGSISAIYPGLKLNYHGLLSVILLFLSFYISYLFALRERD
jgi:putative membrane protein